MTARARDLVAGQRIRAPDGRIVTVETVVRLQGGWVWVIVEDEHGAAERIEYRKDDPVEVIGETT